MKKILTILLIFVTSFVYSQTYDVTISQPHYTAYFENDFMNPTVVVYSLYKGGGGCNRSKFKFKNDRKDIKTATEKNYTNSGYDKGHLANAEDFAFDCALDELTFRFYNCVPQHPKLNRGPWKKIEKDLRKLSQSQEITIMCINIFDGKSFLPESKIGIPTECIKLVWDSKTEQPLRGYVFTNNANPQVFEMTHVEIIQKYNLDVAIFFN